jgi:hypothetical protein
MEINVFAMDSVIRSLLSAKFQNNRQLGDKYNFRCNICGDSKKNKTKKRGYILKNRNPWVYYCQNCQASMSVTRWLKTYFPEYWKEYLSLSCKNQSKETPKLNIPKVLYNEKNDLKHFVPILKGESDLFKKAIELCQARLIPEDTWKKWYVAEGGRFKNRLIIPYFDDKEKIYNYQARRLLEDMEPKYISRIGDHWNKIYNYYKADKEKPVIIFEGVIDSEFVENSIAASGLSKVFDPKIFEFKKRYFLLDSDKDAQKKNLQLLKNGEFIFRWKLFIKDLELPNREKWDINEVNLYLKKSEKWKFSKLEKYFTNSIYLKGECV